MTDQGQSANIGDLAKALAIVQEQLQPAVKDGSNPFYKSKYASLTSCWNSCRALLASNGFAVVQHGGQAGGEFTTQLLHAQADDDQPAREKLAVAMRIDLVTKLIHTSGEWICGTMSAVVDGSGQDVGGAVTYLRRVGLCAIVGISTTEDDGAAPYSKPAQNRPQSSYSPDSDRSGAGTIQARDIHKLGVEVLGEAEWNKARSAWAESASQGGTKIINDLKPGEMKWLLDELKKEKRR